MIAYLPLVNGKSFDEIKLRFLLVKNRLSFIKSHFPFQGFPNGNESQLFSLAFYSTNEFLFYTRSTSVNISQFNSRLIPPYFSVLYANICAIIWSTFVAFVTK
jgi:hypothetical protein